MGDGSSSVIPKGSIDMENMECQFPTKVGRFKLTCVREQPRTESSAERPQLSRVSSSQALANRPTSEFTRPVLLGNTVSNDRPEVIPDIGVADEFTAARAARAA